MKKGFTLAELLVTLGIIGVISALTLPLLFNDVTDAKVGPSLAKAVATFDHANKALFADEEVTAVTDLEGITDFKSDTHIELYWDKLADYMIINPTGNGQTVTTEEGFSFTISTNFDPVVANSTPHLQEITNCTIDINGTNPPNESGTDVFQFILMNDGSLQPKGANGEWKKYCPIGKVPSDPSYCAGHVFENSLKVLYE